MAVVTRIALQHLQWLDPPGNYEVVRFQFFSSEVSRRFDEVTVHIGGRDRWLQLISSTKSFFGISYRHDASVNAQRLDFIENRCV